MKSFVRIFVSTVCLLALSACGSDSGTSDGRMVRVLSPEQDSVFSAGDSIDFTLDTPGFVLAPPFNMRSLELRDSDMGMHGAAGHSDSMASHEHGDNSQHSGDSHGEGSHSHGSHSHGALETNPSAREGHYHVYLNDASGSDPHLTAWSEIGAFELPGDLAPGTHSLRFELRDNNHTRLGSPASETVLFFEVR